MSNTTTHISPYLAAKRVNVALAEAGVESTIPPQMMYNYTTAKVRAGKKPLIEFDVEKGIVVKDFERWLKSYIEKKVAKATEVAEELVNVEG